MGSFLLPQNYRLSGYGRFFLHDGLPGSLDENLKP